MAFLLPAIPLPHLPFLFSIPKTIVPSFDALPSSLLKDSKNRASNRTFIYTFQQAQKAKGNTFCEVKRMKGFQCTLTAWESREAMLNYLRSGAHLVAMKSFSKIATGRTYGFESESIPTWEEAIQLLLEKGKEH